jgi:hypothetical protein
MLVNLSDDSEVVKSLVEDDAFLESLLLRVTVRSTRLAGRLLPLEATIDRPTSRPAT